MSYSEQSIRDLRAKVEQTRGRKMQLLVNKTNIEQTIVNKTEALHANEQAREIMRLVGQKTQEQLSFHISDITSLALGAVFNDPYRLIVDFVQRRNKTECDLLFERDGDTMDPLDSAGGGAVDVAAFALRIASWSMTFPKLRNTIILDEPMRFLSADRQQSASEMIKELSKKLNIQFIIVTLETTLASWADKTFEVGIKKGISYLK